MPAARGSGALADWLFDSARQSGDCDVVDSDPNTYVILFHSVGRQTYNTMDVRHILFQPDTTGLDSKSETYDADLQARRDEEAKAKAEDALAQWKAGDATEDSFAALANELSADGGSNTNGGLYTEVYKGRARWSPSSTTGALPRAARPATPASCSTRTPATTSCTSWVRIPPYWKVEVRNKLTENDFNAWVDGLYDSAEITPDDAGMQYVG